MHKMRFSFHLNNIYLMYCISGKYKSRSCHISMDRWNSHKFFSYPFVFVKTCSFHIWFFLLIFLAAACGPSDEEKARIKLSQARASLQSNDTISVLLHLDSIPELFPKAIYTVNAAGNLSNDIRFSLLHRKEALIDSLKGKILILEKAFKKEKTEFDRYARYVHIRQNFERSWDRSFIQVHLDERGEIYLSSNYCGEKWLNHTSLRVYDRNIDAQTESIPIGDPDNHRSDFMEMKWEKVSYRKGKDNGVMEFIAGNADRNLKAVFLGDEYQYIILESYDKQAIKDAQALSKALKQKRKLELEVQALKKELNI